MQWDIQNILALAVGIVLVVFAGIVLFNRRRPSSHFAEPYFPEETQKAENSDLEDDNIFSQNTLAELGFGTGYAAPKPSPQKGNPDIVSVHVFPKSANSFAGYELLQALLSAGLHYGSMNIFHRHEYSKGTGRVFFSVASAVEPGAFDLSNIGALQCPGLTFFLRLADAKEPLREFEMLLYAANRIADELEGFILSDKREVLTDAEIEKYFQMIVAYQRKKFETV